MKRLNLAVLRRGVCRPREHRTGQAVDQPVGQSEITKLIAVLRFSVAVLQMRSNRKLLAVGGPREGSGPIEFG